MEAKLEWHNEEEGSIIFSEAGTPRLTMQVFVTGEEEAELRIQDIVFPEAETKSDNISDKIISEVTNCISESFLLLWNEGYEETSLVEQKGTKIEEILGSTSVVNYIYSEYMMKLRLAAEESTNSGPDTVILTKEEGGFVCENKDKTFFCRLLPYRAEQPGEACFYLYEVAVAKKKRNKGIATACLMELFGILAAQAPTTIYLQVGSYNEPAVHLYKKLGFTVSEELCCYAPEEEEE